MLSRLQERVLRIVGSVVAQEDFALAGGGALIVRGDVDRPTNDLDLFATTPAAVDRVAQGVRAALEGDELAVRTVRQAGGFVRFEIDDGSETTELDLAADARLFATEPGIGLSILSGEELAVDKVLTIFGRAEARDFIDLAAVEPRYGLAHLLRLAAEKDPGFRPIVFAEMLTRLHRLDRREFGLSDAAFAGLEEQVGSWRALALGPEHGREHDTGLGL